MIDGPGLDETARWRESVLTLLRKTGRAGPDVEVADVEQLLGSTTYDGITVAPLHGSGPPAPAPAPPATVGAWDVRLHHDSADPETLLSALVAEAEGPTSVWIRVGETSTLAATLDVVPLDRVGVVLDAGRHTAAAAMTLLAAVGRAEPGDATVRGNLGADPLGLCARTGDEPDLRMLSGLALRCVAVPLELRAGTVDATAYHEAGGSDGDELACALATGVAYLRAFADAGLPMPAAFDQLEFRYAAGPDQFLTMAKLRAARLLWARVVEACGVTPVRQRQHAVTSPASMTARAPWNNIVRTTLAAFAAVTGGADALTVLPYDGCLGRPDAGARRLARNTHALLKAEAHAARVWDPAAGSWYVERLTRDLARVAWDRFQEIEANSGMAASLADGMVADRLAATSERRQDDVRRLRRTIVGINDFVRPDEELPVREPRPGPVHPAGLPVLRYAEEFERLRDRADAGHRGALRLIALGGDRREAAARVAEQLLATGGLSTVRSTAAETGAPHSAGAVVCLSGVEQQDPAEVRSVVRQVRSAGVTRIWAVGAAVSDLGIDRFLTPGCDVVAALAALADDLGAAQ